jgi:hypothetical protein
MTSADKVSRRDDLIDNVKYGRITPDEAEAEAVRLGLGKLASEPNGSQFDPMRETWWSLPMTVAWMAWRSPDRVREFWDTYRSECWDWHFREWRNGPDGPVHAGHFLEQRRPATLLLLSLAESYDSAHGLLPHGAISINEAKAKLWEALSEHTLQATGISTDSGERVAIPDYAWRDLRDIEERGRDALRMREVSGVWSNRGYNDVALRRQNIMAIWQPHRLEERGYSLPALVKPEGPGYMPLYFAAQWIATCGGNLEIDPCDLPVWQNAFVQLLSRIASEQVAVTGVRQGERERVAGHVFANIQVDYPFSDTPFNLLVSDELYLSCCVYIDKEHWQKGWNDVLETRQGCKWSKLMVLKSDVARCWPFCFGVDETEDPPQIRHTGAPGRPSSMHLVEAEYRARWDRGEAETSIGAEAEMLAEWLWKKHPDVPQLTPKTIANRLRHEHRERIAKARN